MTLRQLSCSTKQCAFLLVLSLFAFVPSIALAESLNLTSGETINILAGATLSLSSPTGIDDILVNETANEATLTLAASDSVTITSANRYIIHNNLVPEQGTNCGSLSSSLTITQSAKVWVSTTDSCIAVSTGGGGGGGGGGSAPVAPTKTSVTINTGATKSTSNSVTLTLSASNADKMLVSNDSNFIGAQWQAYKTSLQWTLTSGLGFKSVYVKFRSSSGGDSNTLIANIDVVAASEPTPQPETTEKKTPVSPPTTVTEGALVKEVGKPAVYIIENGKIRPFLNDRIFGGYGYSFNDVISTDISSYEVGDLISLFPDDYDFTCGQLVKGSNAKVYLVSACNEAGQTDEITWITTQAVFWALGFSFDNLNNISDEKRAKYTEGPEFSSITIHPAGSLIRFSGDSKVYLLQKDGSVLRKRHVADEQTFNSLKFQWRDVVIIPKSEAYPDGAALRVGGSVVLGAEYDSKGEFTLLLTIGSSGDEVELLQNTLKKLGYFPADVNASGYFGTVTKKAVADFQKANGIEPVGHVGPKTRAELNKQK